MQIEKYIHNLNFNKNSYILNAGSGGNTYNLNYKIHHVDIAENKIEHFDSYTVSSIEKLPFTNNEFSDVICVGSVINYTDAFTSISELSRVLRPKGQLILEFESSHGFEYLGTENFGKPSAIVKTEYCGEPHKQWIYSYKYIKNILRVNNIKIKSVYRYHLLSAINYNLYRDENRAAKYTKFDSILRHLPIINRYSNNIMLYCTKL